MSTDAGKQPLPPGWRWARLGNVCPLKDSGVWGSEPHGNARTWPVLRSNNIQDGQIVLDDVARRVVPDDAAANKLLTEGDILITKSSGSAALIGKCALVGALPEACLFSNFTLRLRLKPDEALPEFVFRYLISPPAKAVLAEIQNTTTGLRNLDLDRYLNQLIPFAPVDEQRRIVASLSEQMAQVDKMRSVAEAEVEAAEALPAAFLRQVFESEEAKTWPRRKLGELCQKPQYGYTASATTEDVGPRLLRITDIQDGQVDWDAVPYCKCPATEQPKYLLAPGDILFARSGATTGKTFLVEHVPAQAIFASYLIRLRTGPDLRPQFAYLFLQSDLYWQQVASGRRGGAQPNMNATILAEVSLAVPSLDVQNRLITQLSGQLERAHKLRQTAQAQLKAVSALPGALLEEVFGGFEPPP